MPKNRLLLICLSILLAGFVLICLTPFVVADGVRCWFWWQARRQGLIVELGKIETPFLRPVVVHRVHVTSGHDADWRVELSANRTMVDLNLLGVLVGARGRAIRALSMEGLHVEIHRTSTGRAKSQFDWMTLQKLLPGGFKVSNVELRIEDGASVTLLRNASFSGSEIEAGRFEAAEFTIASPWFRQTFSHLRGATKWQENRLTLGGITLAHGLDLQLMTVDFSHLGKQRADLEFDVDAFGGKMRASLSNDWHARPSNWNIASSATDISLAQTSQAIGFTDRLGGSLRACKFTFRGNVNDATQATASIWTELKDLSWHERTADVIMFGAALYNRQIQLEQLYVKQHKNQLTMSGEGSLPSKSPDWLSPDFRINISGSITDLGDFVSLFGADRGDFAGEIAIDGIMNARDRKIGGHLMAAGNSLSIFKTQIDNLIAKLNLKATELELEQLEIRRKKDFLRAQGKIDMSHKHNYSGTIEATVGNAAEYLSNLVGHAGGDAQSAAAAINATITAGRWDAHVIVNLAGSGPVNLAAKFPLKIGQDWKEFVASPLEVTIDFPAVFLANAPQFFHPEIFSNGILSGKISLSETLQHPRVVGDLQLLDGKLQNAPMNFTEANGRATFNGDRATIDFFNACRKDVCLSCRGEIVFQDSSDMAIRITGTEPIFDLTPYAVDCLSRIELAPVGMTLAPVIRELELRGGMFNSNWTVNLKESGNNQSSGAINWGEAARSLRLCFGTGAGEKALTLGALPRPHMLKEPARPRKRAKRH